MDDGETALIIQKKVNTADFYSLFFLVMLLEYEGLSYS